MLVLTEGSSNYLNSYQMGRLADYLRRHSRCRYWMMDCLAPPYERAVVAPGSDASPAPLMDGEFMYLPGWRLVGKQTISHALFAGGINGGVVSGGALLEKVP